VNGFNVVSQRLIYSYVRQICCNWFRFKPDFSVPARRRTKPQINSFSHFILTSGQPLLF